MNVNLSILFSGVVLPTFEPPEGCNCVEIEDSNCNSDYTARCDFHNGDDDPWCYVDDNCPAKTFSGCQPWANCKGYL